MMAVHDISIPDVTIQGVFARAFFGGVRNVQELNIVGFVRMMMMYLNITMFSGGIVVAFLASPSFRL